MKYVIYTVESKEEMYNDGGNEIYINVVHTIHMTEIGAQRSLEALQQSDEHTEYTIVERILED